MNLKFTRIFILLLLTSVLLIGCQPKQKETDKDQDVNVEQEDNQNSEETDNNSEQTGPSEEEVKALALDFSLSDGKGNEINLSEYKDKLVFLNFFTTWCGYCMDEMPEFQKIYDQYNEDVAVIIVNVNQDANEVSPSEVVAWYEGAGYTFPMVIDEGSSETEAFYPYISGYPTTFVYEKGGRFVGYLSGALDEKTMISIIDEYLKP